MSDELPQIAPRNSSEARRIATATYSFRCCAVCGLQILTCLNIAHLDQNAGNNDPDNLVFLCQTHHWMLDAKLYESQTVKLLRDYWQKTKGVPCHKARMKDAGKLAARKRQHRAAGRKAWVTRRTTEAT